MLYVPEFVQKVVLERFYHKHAALEAFANIAQVAMKDETFGLMWKC